METLNNLDKIQKELVEREIDAWVLPDYRGSNEIFGALVGGKFFMTRRAALLIPRDSKPIALIHIIDKPQFAPVEQMFDVQYYRTWQEHADWFQKQLSPLKKIVTEYSPDNAIPTMSQVDGGTIDILRKYVEVVSSADIYQKTISAWTLQDYEGHKRSVEQTVASLRSALDFIKTSLNSGGQITEIDVQDHLVAQFNERGLVTDHPPIVAVSPNNGDPHYDPQSEKNTVITKESLVLIDLWAKFAQGDCVFADITWMSYFGIKIPTKIVSVFNVVRDARNAAIDFVKENISSGTTIKGYQVDDVSRKIIADAGYGEFFLHRTGHSMGPGNFLHARGVNIDNFETHDEREITSSIGFSIEPGVYLPAFGIRSEVDVFIHPTQGAIVTTPLQEEIEHFTLD